MNDIKSISSNIAMTLVMVVALLAAFAIMATMFAVMLPHREQTVYNNTISAFSVDTRSRQNTSKEVLRYDSKSQGILVPDPLND